ncbi:MULTISPECIES: hypothetical protein [Xanthomonas]|uniref:Uncharacterized protein n=1 Tax=Xanthomonas dyei TaxID=743699 RepID=A0ABZ0D3R4_9XANT|nr:hypothetical protein [Xanthomonas dyei]WOB24791.1 hypothetical protein NYR99_13375 [Xanthomonas dyei]WOB52419.1 hypothetical protein NYR95_13380 [Xanthomonas dyei]
MPRAKKSPGMWYARAQQYRAMADGLQCQEQGLHETKHQHVERRDATELVRRQLIRESERCWREGGRIDATQRAARIDQQAKPEVRNG